MNDGFANPVHDRLLGDRSEAGRSQSVSAGGNLQAVGDMLYRDYLLPFEIASVLLLVAMIGAVILARARY